MAGVHHTTQLADTQATASETNYSFLVPFIVICVVLVLFIPAYHLVAKWYRQRRRKRNASKCSTALILLASVGLRLSDEAVRTLCVVKQSVHEDSMAWHVA